jgi:hypothetical protein
MLAFGRLALPRSDRRHARTARERETALHRVLALVKSLEPRGYRILFDLPLRTSVVDFVVIGPTGVVAVHADGRTGRFRLEQDGFLTYNGRKVVDLVGRCATEATDMKARLRRAGIHIAVHSVVALTGTRLREGPINMGAVTLMEDGDVVPYITGRRSHLSEDLIATACLAARADAHRETGERRRVKHHASTEAYPNRAASLR